MKKICAIHQPNFFPWLGYFSKIARADKFILLNDAQFQKTGGGWTNRVQIRVGDQARWLTAPVDRSYSGTRKICEISFSSRESAWREKVWKTIQQSYAKSPFYKHVAPRIEALLMYESENISDYNCHAILSLSDWLGLGADKIQLASNLKIDSLATDRLISITQAVGAHAYMCGSGASGYQEDEKFAKASIALVYQNFMHPVYNQQSSGPFIPGLSVIDPLMNCGVDGVRRMLNVGDGAV